MNSPSGNDNGPTNLNYSSFFKSGLRAIVNRTRRFSSVLSTPSSSSDAPLPIAPPHRTRTTSMTTPPISKINPEATHVPIAPRASTSPPSLNSTSKFEKDSSTSRTRRSSLASFPSKFLDRMTAGKDSKVPLNSRSNKSKTFSANDMPDVWITRGGPYAAIGSASSFFSTDDDKSVLRPIDPFSSSPDSKSFFIDLTESPGELAAPKRESFLSFSASSEDSMKIFFPRRERPTSIQTMPLPARSRRSSWQYRPESRGKSEFALIVEEIEERSDPTDLDLHSFHSDPAAFSDWRQFHIDLLEDENEVSSDD